MVEYGFQSLPWFSDLLPLTSKEDWHPFSEFMQQRNHHTNGQNELYDHLEMQLGMPACDRSGKEEPWSQDAFRAYCSLTQIVHKMYLQQQTEHYRRQQGTPYHCMGALYWQCNDFWPTISWSGLASDGGWKLAHSGIVEAFLPVLVTATWNKETKSLAVSVNNDLSYEIAGESLDMFMTQK